MDFSLTDEQQAFRDAVRRWVDAETPKSWARELERREEDYPFELWDKLTAAGFHGIGISEEFGGQGGDIVMQMLFARELSRTLGGLLWTWGLTSFAGGKSIGVYGSPAQKQKFLPLIAAGKCRVSIGFTEPGGGTDVLGAMQTMAERAAGGWVLNGQKMWCTAARVADYILLLARTDKNVQKRHQGLTLFLLPAQQKGITATLLPKLGMRAMGSCTVMIDNVFVPDELVLGEPGKAWYTLLPTLNNERIMVGAQCLGAIDGVLEDALDYVKQRKAFGKSISKFQAIQAKLADMSTEIEAGRLLVYKAAREKDAKRNFTLTAAQAKLKTGRLAVRCAEEAVQIHGGYGFIEEYPVCRFYRDAKILTIGEGTDEVQQMVIARALGA